MHSRRYIYPNNVIGPAPLTGGSVTGPPLGPQCVSMCMDVHISPSCKNEEKSLSFTLRQKLTGDSGIQAR